MLDIQKEELEKIDIAKIKELNEQMEKINQPIRLEEINQTNQTIQMSDDEIDIVF